METSRDPADALDLDPLSPTDPQPTADAKLDPAVDESTAEDNAPLDEEQHS